ncbi:MAG: AbrB/MazE/SpoVT family DNA-binding domain-containing protein, partial [Candidatus Nanoarchaeia archaeon]
MEFRKIIEFGKSSYIVSLPKKWVTANKLKKGDVVNVEETAEGLVILPKHKDRKEETSITINVDNQSMKAIRSQIVSSYIQGHHEMIFQGKNLAEHAEDIRESIHNLIALEIMEETSKKIVAKDFLNIRELSVENLIRKMDIIVKEMISDSKQAKDSDVHANIVIRDSDINRIVYLVFRIIRHLQNNPRPAKGMSDEELLKSWVVADSIESIGDHVKSVAGVMRNVKRLEEDGWNDLFRTYTEVETMYRNAIKSYYTKDVELAYKLTVERYELRDACEDLYSKYWKVKYLSQIIERFKFMIS